MCFRSKMTSHLLTLFRNNSRSHTSLSTIRYPFKNFFLYLSTYFFLEICVLMELFNTFKALVTNIKIFTVIAMIFHIFDGLDITNITLISKKGVLVKIFMTFIVIFLVLLFRFGCLRSSAAEPFLFHHGRRT